MQGLIDRGVDRFVYAALSTRVTRLPDALLDRVTVLVNCEDPRSIATAIVPDESYAGALAARTLLDAGHTDRIWLVGQTSRGPYAGRERRKAVVATLAAHGLVLSRHVTLRLVAAPGSGGVSPRRWPPPRHQDGRGPAAARPPRDLSGAVSFDNSELSSWLSPGLTSIGLPYFEMGRRAVEVLLGVAPSDTVERVHMPLHQRESVAVPRRGRR